MQIVDLLDHIKCKVGMSKDDKNVTSNQVSAILAPTPTGHQLPQLDLLGLHLVDQQVLTGQDLLHYPGGDGSDQLSLANISYVDDPSVAVDACYCLQQINIYSYNPSLRNCL